MTPRSKAIAGLALASLLLAGACSQDVLIGDEQSGTGAAPGVTSTTSSSTGGGAASVWPIDPEAAARVAVLLRSCGLADPPEVILHHFYSLVPGSNDSDSRLAQAIGCIDGAKGTGCFAVQQCVGVTASAKAACVPGCTGSVLHTCDGNIDRTLDCAKLGLTCVPGANRCLAAPLGPACDEATFASTCNGGIPEACDGTVVHGPDCAAHGLVCELFDIGTINAVCKGEGPGCDGFVGLDVIRLDSGVACDGNLLRACINSREHPFDCTQIGIGFTCQTETANAICGLAPDCVPGQEETLCDAAKKTLTVCNAGLRDHVACDDVGLFGGCEGNHCNVALGGP